MSTHPRSRSRASVFGSVLYLLATLSACADQPQPTMPSALDAAGAAAAAQFPQSDDTPFYYHEGQKIALEIDPSIMVVSARGPDPASAAVEVLAGAGIRNVSTESLPHGAGLTLLHLPSATSRAAALAARARLRVDQRFDFASTGYRAVETGSFVWLLDRVAVQFRPGVTRTQIAALNAELGTRVVREPRAGVSDVYWLRYPRGADPLAVAAALDQHPLVQWADPDKVADRRLMYVPTDPFYSQQYYLKNTVVYNGYRVDDNVEEAWEITTGQWAPSTGGFQIAVVDDGVEWSHPDFNGHVYQFGGYDAFNISPSYASNPEFSNDSHGTAVAGLIVAQHNNSAGLAGIAPGVYIRPIRIFRSGTAASDAQIGDALNFAWQAGAQVINNSWGGGPASNSITTAIQNAVTQGRSGKGTVVVFAAGNTSNRAAGIIGSVHYPGSRSEVITVSAINRNGTLTNYSPEGSAIDIVAPSGHITNLCVGDVVSTDLLGSRGCNDGPGGNIDYTSTFSGTSAATPQVAAAAALLLSKETSLTETQVKNRLYAAADPWGTATQFGRGKLDVYGTMMGSFYVNIGGPNWIDTNGTYTWTAAASGGNGVYSYQWQYSTNGSTFSNVGGNSSTYSRYVGVTGGNFWLRVRATSLSTTVSSTQKVIVDDGICSPGELC